MEYKWDTFGIFTYMGYISTGYGRFLLEIDFYWKYMGYKWDTFEFGIHTFGIHMGYIGSIFTGNRFLLEIWDTKGGTPGDIKDFAQHTTQRSACARGANDFGEVLTK